MRFPICAFLAVAFLAVAAPVLDGAIPFPQEASDLKPDPAARFGVLPNGLRYVVRPNREPRGRASLRLLVLSGSLEETEAQRGLAHFLEHMAFNGSTHYPPGTLVEYFQRLGMSFGGDANAYTSFDHTAYEIELPDVRPGTVAEGLRVFSDFAGGLLLVPGMIDKERPIILSEKRTRDSVEYRQFVAAFDFLLGDTRLDKRLPIGLQPVIEQARRDRFADLYDTWYRPERMVVIVVGDVDPDAVVPQIAAAFSPVRDRAPARPDPDLGHATTALGLRTAYDFEPEAGSTTVAIDVIAPYSYRPDTAALRLLHLPRDLAVAILNRRLEILAKKEGAPFIRASAAIDEQFNLFRDAGLEISCAPAQWATALGVGEQELRRALSFGFADYELREAAANLRNDLEQAAASEATRRSPDLAAELIDSLVQKSVFTSPAQELALVGPALAKVTPENCRDALRLAFAPPGRFIMVSGNSRIEGDARARIAAAYQAAHAVEVRPPAAIEDSRFAYQDFGPSGSVAVRKQIEDLGITELVFANGVRANLKRTPFEANQIRIKLRVGAGRLVEPRTEPGLAFFSDLSFEAGGLGRQSVDDLQRVLAGRTVATEFEVGDDALEIAAKTNGQDLELQLELLAAELSDPGYRPEALRLARKESEEYFDQLDHAIEGPLEADIPRLLASGDPRFGLPSRSDAAARTLGEEKVWLAPQLSSGPVEIGIVGDIDIDATVAALSRTLGALPFRNSKPAYTEERAVRVPASPLNQSITIPTEIPKAVVALYWPTADGRDIRRARRLRILADILADRLRVKIREQLGGTYAPEAASEPSDTFTDFGLITAEVVVAPERAAEIRAAILAIADNLQRNGVTPDELERARRPLLTAVRESVRSNDYWLEAVLANCQEYPQRLDWARTREADLAEITAADVDSLARRYLSPDRAFRFTILPAQK